MQYHQKKRYRVTVGLFHLLTEEVGRPSSLFQQLLGCQALWYRQHRQIVSYRASLTRCFPTAILRVKRESIGIILTFAGICVLWPEKFIRERSSNL
jgi:hypothetical protein